MMGDSKDNICVPGAEGLGPDGSKIEDFRRDLKKPSWQRVTVRA
jgi:hypothetical protein